MTDPIRIRPYSPPAADPAVLDLIDEESIHRLVHRFYDAVRVDDVIGPVFNTRIAPQDWPTHLARMCDFWSNAVLRTGRYEGRPLAPHLAMPELSDPHFIRWLSLFRATAREVFAPAGAQVFIALSERIAHSFRLAIAFNRGEDTTAIAPLPADESWTPPA